MPPVKTSAALGNLGGVFLYHHEEIKEMGAHEDIAAKSGTTLEQLMREGVVATEDCRYGRMCFLRTDIYIAQSLGLYGEFSEAEVQIWRRFVKPGATVVTGGANCGSHVLALADLVGHGGKVFSVEPQPIQAQLTAINVGASGHDGVRVKHAAFGSARGKAYVPELDYRWPFSFGSIGSTGFSRKGDIEVDAVTIDELADGHAVSFIHLDCEGNEAAALRGAAATIALYKPVLYVEVDRSEAAKDTLALLERAGYDVMIHHAPLFNPGNFKGNRFNVFGDTVSISALALPRGVPQ
jgi:FkbM family methyltransferase